MEMKWGLYQSKIKPEKQTLEQIHPQADFLS